MKADIYFHTFFIVVILLFSICKADSLDESESFCSVDPDGSCSVPSRNNLNNPLKGLEAFFKHIYSGYAKKIKRITETKDKIRKAEFEIPEGSIIEKIDSTNYSLLANGTWLVQIYSPWCPYSIHFQKTWKRVVSDVKNINEHILDGKFSFDEESKSDKDQKQEKNKDEEKEDKEELIIKKRNIMKNLRFAQIDAYENVDVAALLEVKGFPTVKMLHKGNAVTYTNSTTYDRLVRFVVDDWMKQEWYNRLPKTPSKLYQLQIKFSLLVYKILYYLHISIYIPFKYLTLILFVYLAYNINILGKIRYGLIHARQYFSAFVPEILDME